MAQLASRNDVNWQKVQLAAQSWNYSQQGLTGAAAAIIAIVVAVASYGAASEWSASIASGAGMTTTAGAAGASTIAATGAGVAGSGVAAGTVLTTTGAALSTAAAAGMSTLASEAAVSLADNGGDIGKTLQYMGSSQSVKNIVAAMLTAGIGQTLDGYSVGTMAGKTVVGCAAGSISGAGCQNGAESAGITDAAAWSYNSMVGYNANAGLGRNPDPNTLDMSSHPDVTNPNYYTYNIATGQQDLSTFGNNVIGLNRKTLGFFAQGGPVSDTLNYVPFINAIAGVHDWFFNYSPTLNSIFAELNVPLMAPAALWGIPASLGNSNVSYLLPVQLPKSNKQ